MFRRKKRDRGRGKREERIIGREDLVVGGREREEDVIEGEIHTYKVESSHLYVGEVVLLKVYISAKSDVRFLTNSCREKLHCIALKYL